MLLELKGRINLPDDIKNLLDIALEIEKTALADDYFKKRNLYPNIDFYAGLVLISIQIPERMLNVIFGVARSFGWIAHWRE